MWHHTGIESSHFCLIEARDRSELGQAYHFDEVAAVVELDKCVRRSDSAYDKYSRTEAFWFSGVPSLFRSQTFSYVEAKHLVWKDRSLPISISLDHVIRSVWK